MEHESFEHSGIAALLNEHFVSIKVDREERPDVDRVYMAFRAGDHRLRRLADERLADARPEAVLRRHLLSARLALGAGRISRRAAGGCQTLGVQPRRAAAVGRRIARAVAGVAGAVGRRDRGRQRRRRGSRDRCARGRRAAVRRVLRHAARRLRRGAQVSPAGRVALPAPGVGPRRRRQRPPHRGGYPGGDGQRGHARPHRRRFPSLLGRRRVARAALREDALRPGAARPRLHRGGAGGRRGRAAAGGRGHDRVRAARHDEPRGRLLFRRGCRQPAPGGGGNGCGEVRGRLLSLDGHRGGRAARRRRGGGETAARDPGRRQRAAGPDGGVPRQVHPVPAAGHRRDREADRPHRGRRHGDAGRGARDVVRRAGETAPAASRRQGARGVERPDDRGAGAGRACARRRGGRTQPGGSGAGGDVRARAVVGPGPAHPAAARPRRRRLHRRLRRGLRLPGLGAAGAVPDRRRPGVAGLGSRPPGPAGRAVLGRRRRRLVRDHRRGSLRAPAGSRRSTTGPSPPPARWRSRISLR